MDDNDIQCIVDQLLTNVRLMHPLDETRVAAIYDIALGVGQLGGLTDAGAKDLAETVRRKVEWAVYRKHRQGT